MHPPEPKKQKTGSPAIVHLNVGGGFFSTTRMTLLQSGSSYFARLLGDKDEDMGLAGALYDEQGRLFIDRDPTLFKQVLSYLRNRDNFSIECQDERDKLHKEALFYQLDGLIEMTRPPSTGYDEMCLSNEDRAILCDAQLVRDNLKRGIGVAQADKILIDLFPTQPQQREPRFPLEKLFDKQTSSPECCILFDKRAEHVRTKHPPNPAASVEEFKSRLEQFGGPLLRDFPMRNVIIAGGAVLSCLLGRSSELSDKSDVDVFLVADTPEETRSAFDDILNHLSRRRVGAVAEAIGHQELLVARSPCAITFCVGYPQRHIQLITIRHQCVAEVLLSFDIDCCQVAWDGRSVVATPSALRALQTGINICDPDRASSEYEWRLAKYAMRGFLVAVPGLDTNRVDEKLIRNNYFAYQGRQLKRIQVQRTKQGDTFCFEKDSEIKGLSLLLVLSTVYFKGAYYGSTEGQERVAEVFVSSCANGSLGTRNYLLDYSELAELENRGWYMRKLPYSPQEELLCDIGHVRWVNTVGMEILSWDDSPKDVFRTLNGMSSRGADIHDQRLICYDFLAGDRESNDCPHIVDASTQYPNYPFASGRSNLKRFLEFPSSAHANSIPWESGVSTEEWTRGVYKSGC